MAQILAIEAYALNFIPDSLFPKGCRGSNPCSGVYVNKMDNKKLKKEIEKGNKWVKKQKSITYSKNFKTIKGHFNDMKDFIIDNKGFFLIKIYPKTKEIGTAYVEYKTYQIKYEVKGKRAQDIYNTIYNKLKTKTSLDHAAYLGKELKKAEYALKNNEEYIQE